MALNGLFVLMCR